MGWVRSSVLAAETYGLQDSGELPATPTILRPLRPSPPTNPWGLQDIATPLMEISISKGAAQASVTYTSVEAFQALPPVSPSSRFPVPLECLKLSHQLLLQQGFLCLLDASAHQLTMYFSQLLYA